MIFQDVFRTIILAAVLLFIPCMFFLIRMLTVEMRSVCSELQEANRVLREIRDHQKGIKRRRVKVE
ncbi:MAG: hypothetical protein AB1742_15400 [bacterium]